MRMPCQLNLVVGSITVVSVGGAPVLDLLIPAIGQGSGRDVGGVKEIAIFHDLADHSKDAVVVHNDFIAELAVFVPAAEVLIDVVTKVIRKARQRVGGLLSSHNSGFYGLEGSGRNITQFVCQYDTTLVG